MYFAEMLILTERFIVNLKFKKISCVQTNFSFYVLIDILCKLQMQTKILEKVSCLK